jgi:hypothetical protein
VGGRGHGGDDEAWVLEVFQLERVEQLRGRGAAACASRPRAAQIAPGVPERANKVHATEEGGGGWRVEGGGGRGEGGCASKVWSSISLTKCSSRSSSESITYERGGAPQHEE